MKRISFFLLGCAGLFIASCSKEASLENHLDGETWRYTKVTTVMSGNTTESTNLTASISFDKDGSGTMKESDSAPEKSFNWKVLANGDSLQITQGSSKMTVRVLSNKKSTQVWSLGSETGPLYFKYELKKD